MTSRDIHLHTLKTQISRKRNEIARNRKRHLGSSGTVALLRGIFDQPFFWLQWHFKMRLSIVSRLWKLIGNNIPPFHTLQKERIITKTAVKITQMSFNWVENSGWFGESVKYGVTEVGYWQATRPSYSLVLPYFLSYSLVLKEFLQRRHHSDLWHNLLYRCSWGKISRNNVNITGDFDVLWYFLWHFIEEIRIVNIVDIVIWHVNLQCFLSL